jgi:multidrug efflux pump subunit AcrA (membrane-fusion protein)
MQIKVRIHEAKIERVKLKLPARIELQDKTLEGKVLSVASMAAPAGWWNGNMVKYETIITVDTPAQLKPGMSANVDIILAQYNDVVAIPVAAVVEQGERFFCWVKTAQGTQRRELALGDSDDQFLVVKAGVKEGDQVVLNPLAYIEEAQAEALKPFSGVAASKEEKAAKPADDELKTMKPPENEQTDKDRTDAAVERKSPGAE